MCIVPLLSYVTFPVKTTELSIVGVYWEWCSHTVCLLCCDWKCWQKVNGPVAQQAFWLVKAKRERAAYEWLLLVPLRGGLAIVHAAVTGTRNGNDHYYY